MPINLNDELEVLVFIFPARHSKKFNGFNYCNDTSPNEDENFSPEQRAMRLSVSGPKRNSNAYHMER